MKISEWKKQYDKKHPGNQVRAICVNDLLKITEFDEGINEDIPISDNSSYNNCKHARTYSLLMPGPNTVDAFNEAADARKLTSELLKSAHEIKEVTYFELPWDLQEKVDASYKEFNLMECSVHCVKTIKDIQ